MVVLFWIRLDQICPKWIKLDQIGSKKIKIDRVDFNFSFPIQIRRNFVKKVYGILFCQLLLTFAIVLPFAFHTPLRLYVRNNSYLYWVAFVIVIVCLVSMACCEGEHYFFFQKVLNFDALKIYDKLSKIAGELYVVLIAYVHCNCYL